MEAASRYFSLPINIISKAFIEKINNTFCINFSNMF